MKIGFTGTMSVGKTTLVNYLSLLPEFENYEFRTERSKYLKDIGIPLNLDSTLKGQIIFLAERCTELYQPNIITDRTILDVMAFTNLAQSIPYIHSDVYEDLASALLSEYDYIFYVSPKGVEIEDNGVRTIDAEYRKKVDQEIKQLIFKYRGKLKNYVELEGSTEDRALKVKQTIFS